MKNSGSGKNKSTRLKEKRPDRPGAGKRKKHIVKHLWLILALYAFTGVLACACQGTTDTSETVRFASYDGDSAMLLKDGQEAFEARLNLIENASESIDLTTYIYGTDQKAHEIAAALLDAADRGVQVRIVLDHLFGLRHYAGTLIYALGSHPNIDIKVYNKYGILLPWRLHFCFHEKCLAVDGKVCIIGGRNVENRFLSSDSGIFTEHDLDVAVWTLNPAVSRHMEELWNGKTVTQCFSRPPLLRSRAVQKKQESLRELNDSLSIIYKDVIERNLRDGSIPIEGFALISNPHNLSVKHPSSWNRILNLLEGARERVLLETPYFVINRPMHNDLCRLTSNVPSVICITNSFSAGSNPFTLADMTIHGSMFKNLDMELWELQQNKPVHTKAAVIDGYTSIVGSMNFDMRSVYIDTELTAVVRGEEFARELEKYIYGLKADSLKVAASGGYEEGTVEPLRVSLLKKAALMFLAPLAGLVRYVL